MDFHILIIIACVFLASLFSLLFINKFFRRKTFEEIVAEKKAMTEKIYGPVKAAKKQARTKLPTKKELKREKRQKQQKKAEDNTTEVDDSDAQSENPSVEDSPRPEQQQQAGKKAVQPVAHVEFAAEAEVVDSDNGSSAGQRRSSADSNNQKSSKSNKQRKNANTKSAGILANKNEVVFVKEVATEEDRSLNHFETKPPKDILELKKQENLESKKAKESKKTTKNQPKKDHQLAAEVVEGLSVAKELKQLDEKPVRTGSPKNQSNKLKQQNKKKNDKENVALDKINDNDTIGVNLLMNLFGRAELNRSEIQILIDYLLNKQQDMPASHSEWSDDIVQKLKKQLEEKEKALHEEQEASVGIQAKLRELRTETNSERAQMNSTIKKLVEEIQSQKNEIIALNQDKENLNDKFTLERQQLQNKLRLEKQAGSQDIILQLQRANERVALLQAELVHKEQAISELKCLVNATHQGVEDTKQKTNEVIQTQVNQIHVLEQKLDEAEVLINEQRYALDKAKTTESECETNKVDLRNLQNALDSLQAEHDLARNQLGDMQQEMNVVNLQNKELTEENGRINNRAEENSKEKSDLQHTLDVLQTALEEKDRKVAEYAALLASKEDEHIKQIQELKEKNNDLRTKNWKLVDALQAAEIAKKQVNNNLVQQQEQQALLLSQQQQSLLRTTTIQSDPANDQKQIREILERLYPDAVKANAGSALSLSFDQWIEQVLATHVKQSISKNSVTTATNTPTTNSNSSNNHSSHNHNNLSSSEDTKNSSVSINNSSSVSSSSNSGLESLPAAVKAELLKLKSENAQLRANSAEMTKIVTKTGNTLLELEAHAREQDDKWRSIVRSKEEEINLLKHSNGEEKTFNVE